MGMPRMMTMPPCCRGGGGGEVEEERKTGERGVEDEETEDAEGASKTSNMLVL